MTVQWLFHVQKWLGYLNLLVHESPVYGGETGKQDAIVVIAIDMAKLDAILSSKKLVGSRVCNWREFLIGQAMEFFPIIGFIELLGCHKYGSTEVQWHCKKFNMGPPLEVLSHSVSMVFNC